MKFDNTDDVVQLSPDWTGERFSDGRPKVPENILRRFEAITTEEAWGVLWGHGYQYQFEGGLKTVQPG